MSRSIRLTIVPKRPRVKRICARPLVWCRWDGIDQLYSARARGDVRHASRNVPLRAPASPAQSVGGRFGRGAEPPSELSERLEARASAGGDDAPRHREMSGEHDDVGIGVALEKAATGLAGKIRIAAE